MKMMIRTVLGCIAFVGAITLAGCHSEQAQAPAAPPVQKSTFTSQIDGNPSMTPEQKAAAKQQVERLQTAPAGTAPAPASH